MSGGLLRQTLPTAASTSLGTQGPPGVDGLSAYQVALATGFIGSSAAWLASLIGPQGPQGIQGIPGIPGNQVNGTTRVHYANTIEEAFALIAPVDAAGGGVICLIEGIHTYIGSRSIALDFTACANPMVLTGMGRGITTMKWPNNFGTVQNTYAAGDRLVRGGNNFTLMDITLDGNKQNQTPWNGVARTNQGCGGFNCVGTTLVFKKNLRLRNVHIKNTNHTCCYILYVDGYILIDCLFEESYNIGTYYFNIYPDWSFEHPLGTFLNASRNGVCFEVYNFRTGLDALQINGCTNTKFIGGSVDTGGIGIHAATPIFSMPSTAGGCYITNSTDTWIVNSQLNNSTEDGIGIISNPIGTYGNTYILFNRIFNNDMSGISVYGAKNTKIIGNDIYDNALNQVREIQRSAGVSTSSSNGVQIVANKILDSRVGTARTQLYGIINFGVLYYPVPLQTLSTDVMAALNSTSNHPSGNIVGIPSGGNSLDGVWGGIAGTVGTQTFDAVITKSRGMTLNAPVITAGAVSFDLSVAGAFQITRNAHITSISIVNIPFATAVVEFQVQLIGNGSVFTVAWPANVSFGAAGAPALTAAAGKSDMITFKTVNSGTTWFATAQLNF